MPSCHFECQKPFVLGPDSTPGNDVNLWLLFLLLVPLVLVIACIIRRARIASKWKKSINSHEIPSYGAGSSNHDALLANYADTNV